MIDPSVLLSLETKNEIRIAVKLSASELPMRHKNIAETLKINKKRCSDAIKSLVEKRIIVEETMFGVTVYSVSDEVQNESTRVQNESTRVQNESTRIQNESTRIQNESTKTQKAPASSPFHGESAVNMLTDHLVNSSINPSKKDSEISEESQASVETAPEAPETPPKIDAGAFADQTGQSLPQCDTAAEPPILAPETPSTLMPIRKNPYAQKKTPPPERGTIFTKETDDDPTESLYIMDKMLETMPPMQDPSAKYSINQDRESEMVSALEARNIFVYRLSHAKYPRQH